MDKVLVVDNDKENLKKTADGFRELHHFKLLTATHIEAAVETLQKERVSVVATNIHLPKTDGTQLLAYVSRKLPSVACIVMLEPTDPKPAFADRNGAKAALSYIRKPFSFGDLASKIFAGLNLRDEGLTRKGMRLADILPLFVIAGKTCRLEVRRSAQKIGHIDFSEGNLIDARANSMKGGIAVKEMANWQGFQMSISKLPQDREPNGVDAELINILNASWEKPVKTEPPKTDATAGPKTQAPSKAATAQTDASAAPPAGRNKLENAVAKHCPVLRAIKGYKGLAILNPEGKILARDRPNGSPNESPDDSVDFQAIANAMTTMHTDCSKRLHHQQMGPCNALMLHTPQGILIMRTTDVYTGGNYRFVTVLSEEGNGYYLQTQLKNLVPKILAEL